MFKRANVSRARRIKVALILAMTAVASMLATVPAGATGPVAKFVMTPHPIGTATTVIAGSTINITVTAETATNAPVPGASVFLAFAQAIGGGTAFIGSTALGTKPALFSADAAGTILITYSTPSVYPVAGVDVIRAENGATVATSTIRLANAFCFSQITTMALVPKSIARKGSLGPNTTVPVTLTVFGPSAARFANGLVWITFKRAAGGGSAAVGSTDLTSGAPKAFTTNSSGQVTINYKTPSNLPETGVDRLIAGDWSTNACVLTTDAYSFG
jgi:hypothetical protein